MKLLQPIFMVLVGAISALMIVQTAAAAGKGGAGPEAAVGIDIIRLTDRAGGKILAEISGGGFLGGLDGARSVEVILDDDTPDVTSLRVTVHSADLLSATIPEDSLSFTSGEPSRIEWTSDSGTQRYGLLCGACGTRIVNGQTPSIGFYSLRAGTFADTSWVRPAGHIWMRSAQAWFRPDAEDILCEQQPSDYMPLVERFSSFQTFAD